LENVQQGAGFLKRAESRSDVKSRSPKALLTPPSPPNVHGRYLRLVAMAERGTEREAAVAEAKLTSLRRSYDFSESADSKIDLFADASRIQPDWTKNRHLMVLNMQDAPIGSLVKWVLLSGYTDPVNGGF